MGGIWAAIISAFMGIIKGIFGTDKPMVTEVQNARPEMPVDNRSDVELLADCGVRLDPRPENKDGLHDSSSWETTTGCLAGSGSERKAP